ncbi:hypothetical protein ACFSR7_12485 [Cohnella sp. GCM10020058]
MDRAVIERIIDDLDTKMEEAQDEAEAWGLNYAADQLRQALQDG